MRTRSSYDSAAVTIISAAAARLGNHSVTFDLDRANAGGSFVWIDGSPSSLSIDNPTLTLGACEILELPRSTIKPFGIRARYWMSPTTARTLTCHLGFRGSMGWARC